MTETEVLRSMVQSFRILELQTLMIFAGKSRFGRKTDLQNRALELVSGNDEKIMKKIRELSGEMYKAIGGASSVNPYSANYVGGNVNQPVPEKPPPTASAAPAAPAEKPDKVAQKGDAEDLPLKKPKGKNKEERRKRKNKEKKRKNELKKKLTKSPTKYKLSPKKAPPPSARPAVPAAPAAPAAPTPIQRDAGQRRSRRTAAIAATAALAAQAAQDKNIGAVSSSSDEDADDDESSSDESSSSSESETEEATEEQQQVQPKKRARQTRSQKPPPVFTAAPPAPPTTAASVPPAPANHPFSSMHSASALAASYAHLMGRGSYMAQNLVGPQGNPQAAVKPAGSMPNFCGFTYRTSSSASKANQSGGQSHIPPAATANPQFHMGGFGNGSKSHLVYPTFADVKLRKLPFYDVMATLLKPSSLQPTGSARFQEQTFSFHLTPQQVSEIEQSNYRDAMGRPEYKKQIQLRFSLLETSCEQNDNFPSSVSVKVNGRLQPLPNPVPTNKPGVEPKRPPKAINVTGLCKLSSTVANYVNVSWTVEVGRGYTLSVYFVEKLSSSDLLSRLKAKGQRHPDYTRAVIKDKLNDTDSEISTTSCKVTLACPLGKMRMRLPCRSSACDHLQCFDANNYLMMNEKRDKWMCPVCNKEASYDTLMLDGYFTEMLSSRRLPDDEHEIALHPDASWDPLPPKIPDHLDPKHFQQEKPKPAVNNVETLSLTDDDSEQPPLHQAPPPPAKPKSKSNEDVECVTLDSSGGEDNEDEIVPPLSKRGRFTAPELLDDDSRDSPSSSVNAITPAPSTATIQSSSSSSSAESTPNSLDDAHAKLVALAAAAANGEDRRRAREIQQLVRLSSTNDADNPPLICLDDDDD